MGWNNADSNFVMGTTQAVGTDTSVASCYAKGTLAANLSGDVTGTVLTETQNSITTMTGLSAIGKADTNTTFTGPIVANNGATFTSNKIIDFSAARPQGTWNGSVNTADGSTLVLDVTSDNHTGPIVHADLDGTVTTVAQNSITTMTGLTAVGTAGTTTTFSGPIAIAENQTITTTSGNLVVDPATQILEIKGDGTSVVGQIQLNCHNNNHGQKIKSQPHSESVSNELMLPKGGNSTLVSEIATQTLTNKTLASPTITGTGSIAGTFTGNVTGNLDGIVGGTTPAAGSFTEIASTGNITMTGKFLKQF